MSAVVRSVKRVLRCCCCCCLQGTHTQERYLAACTCCTLRRCGPSPVERCGQSRLGSCLSPVCCCIPAWRFLLARRKLRRTVVFFVLAAVLFVTLHYKVLPESMGYYDEDCFIQEERRERMRFVLRHVVQTLNDENATYWLDYGTLLGVIRGGDIMAHDGDVDVSRLSDDLKADSEMMSRTNTKLKTVGIEGSEMVAKYKDVQVDLFRWQTHNISGQPVLQKWYPFVPKTYLGEVISDFLFPPDIPASVLFPLRQISLFGVYASIPHKPLDFLKIKYPLTWFIEFPYKWKCWTRSQDSGAKRLK